MGTFESHITIAVHNSETISKFQTLCQELKIKCLLIELPQGQYSCQPMTSQYHHGSLTEILANVRSLAQYITNRGFTVTRIKLEASVNATANNEEIPPDNQAAINFSPNNYFEFHILVTIGEEDEMVRLQTVCQEFQAHLSTNAFKRSADGHTKHFVTLRLYSVGRQEAVSRFEKLMAALTAKDFQLSNRLQEYIVYDSNIDLDKDWMATLLN